MALRVPLAILNRDAKPAFRITAARARESFCAGAQAATSQLLIEAIHSARVARLTYGENGNGVGRVAGCSWGGSLGSTARGQKQ